MLFLLQLGFELQGWDLSLEARIWASRLGFGASRLGFEPRGWDLSLEARIWARGGIEKKKKKEKKEKKEEKEKVSHMCESIGHRPLIYHYQFAISQISLPQILSKLVLK